jgi:trigger factor
LSLQIEQQETEQRELRLTVRVDESRVQEEIRRAARRFARNLRIPGFRPGKAPFDVVQRWVGKEALRGEAVESITEEIYREALEQADVVPFAPGSLDDIEMEPLVLHMTIPLEPVVELGDYRQVRIDPPQVEVPDEKVNEAMKAIQERHALLEPADRPAREGDVVIADLRAEQEGETTLERTGAELLLDPETLYPSIPFVANVVGMSAGEEKSFDITMPADAVEDEEEDEEGNGKEDEKEVVTYTVKVHEIKARYLPPLNDDLAKEEGDFETLLELRIDVRQRLTEAAQRKADSEYVDQVFDKIKDGASVIFPPAAVEQELDSLVEEMEERYERQGWALEDVLKFQAKTVEDLREELRPRAEDQVTRSQITVALLRAERLSTSEAELDQLVDERVSAMGDVDDEIGNQLREFYQSGQGRLFMANDMLMTKFTERLKAIGCGEAPELPELSEEEE